jgi:hypothetical protein
MDEAAAFLLGVPEAGERWRARREAVREPTFELGPDLPSA